NRTRWLQIALHRYHLLDSDACASKTQGHHLLRKLGASVRSAQAANREVRRKRPGLTWKANPAEPRIDVLMQLFQRLRQTGDANPYHSRSLGRREASGPLHSELELGDAMGSFGDGVHNRRDLHCRNTPEKFDSQMNV